MNSKKLSKKKLDELKCAEFFISSLNKRYGFDYEAKPNKNEDFKDKEIDIYAFSVSGKYPQLNLQIRRIDDAMIREFVKLQNISRRTGQNVVMGIGQDLAIEEWTKNAIETKERKYGYGNTIKKDLILLVWIDFGPLLNDGYAQKAFSELKKSEFKGVYMVHLPAFSKNSSHPHNGQIITIKDIYGNHGKSF